MNKFLAEKLDVFIIVYLDDIFIYTKNKEKKHVEAIQWLLNKLQKYLLYINLKKCQSYQDKMRFLSYIISHQNIQIKEKQIKVICDWPEP